MCIRNLKDLICVKINLYPVLKVQNYCYNMSVETNFDTHYQPTPEEKLVIQY